MIPSFKSPVRNINIFQVPNLPSFSQIISDLDQNFRISSISSNNMIYNVIDDPILQVFSQEPSTSSKSPTYPLSVKSYPILIILS